MAFELNETLNQILIKIASGVNYASDLAKNTGKSIPVMFRQLDELIQKGILTKERNGKRVEYVIEWKSLAHSLASFIRSEFDSAKEVLSSLHIEPMSLENIEKTRDEYKQLLA